MENNYFIRNLETGKLELHFDKSTYQDLDRELKQKVKNYFLWSRYAGAWVSKGKFDGYWPLAIAQELGLEDGKAEGERLSFAEQQDRKVKRAEAREERYEAQADKAEAKGTRLQAEHKRNCQDHAYVFQPGMGGAFDRYRERVANRYGKGFEEYRKSQHYRNMAATAARTASQAKLTRPDFLDRRITEAETELRELTRRMDRINSPEYLAEHGDNPDLAPYAERLEQRFEEVADKLNFYKAKLEGIGGIAYTPENIKPGAVVKIRRSWCKVVRANPKTVSVVIVDGPCVGWKFKYPYAEIQELRAAV
jgi:hypothetical protein